MAENCCKKIEKACCEKVYQFDISGQEGPQGKQGAQGRQGSQGSSGSQGLSGSQGSQGSSGSSQAPLLFGGMISYFAQGGTESPDFGLYYTFGMGLSSFQLPPAQIGTRSRIAALPLKLPIQFTSSNSVDFPITEPNDLYFRVPGVGPRRLSGLRYSIEYGLEDTFPINNFPAILGIWSGPAVGSFSRPLLQQTNLVSNFLLYDIRAFESKFQQGENLTENLIVQGGDYIALVLLTPGNVGTISNVQIYVNASVEIS